MTKQTLGDAEFMTESTITFANHNQILALFGAQDRHLRQIRDAVGVEVVVRGDEIQLHGEGEEIRQGMDVFAELKAVLERKGHIKDEDVSRAIRQVTGGRRAGWPLEGARD